MMEGTMSGTALSSQKEYEVLIHAISHEHTRDNFDRHVLVLEKWLRDYEKGFFLRDLPSINFIIVLLRERMVTQNELFQPIVIGMLKVASQPLYESKANERLRTYVRNNIVTFYIELAKIWEICDMRTRITLASTFRCIVNGGVDPRILKVDVTPFAPQDDRTPMADKVYIQGLLRESGVTCTIVREFLVSVDLMCSFAPDAAESMAAPLEVKKKKDDGVDDEAAPESTQSGSGSGTLPRDKTGMDEDSDEEAFNNTLAASTSIVDGGAGAVGEPSLADASSALLSKTDDGAGAASEAGKTFLDLCVELSADIDTCVLMADTSVCVGLIKLLTIAASESLRDERVAVCVDMIWKCMGERTNAVVGPALQETGGHNKARNTFADMKELIDFDYAVTTLKTLFLRLLFEGYRLADKELRNEVVILFTVLANFPQAVPYFVSSGLITTLVTYACVGEAGVDSWPFFDENIAKPRNFATAFDVDLQLKSSLWMLIDDLLHSTDPDVMLCVGASPLLSVVLSYMEVNSSENRNTAGSTVRDTSQLDGEQSLMSMMDEQNSTLLPYPREARDMSHIPDFPPLPGNEPTPTEAKDDTAVKQYFNALPIAQLRDLQVLGMNFVSKNATLLMGEFVRVDGPLRVLEVIHRYCDSNESAHMDLVYNALLVLTRCLMSNNTIKPILQRQDFVAICLHIFSHSDEEFARAQSLRLVSIMCSNGEENQRQFRVNQGPLLVVKEISKMVRSRAIQVGRTARLKVQGMNSDSDGAVVGGDTSVLTVAMLDVIHKGIIGNATNEAAFANVEGMDALLDLLETSDFLQRIKVLRVLADLLENARLTPYAHAWRSARTMRPAAQIITHSWMDEESRLHVARDEGVVCNIFDPLGDHAWPEPELGARTQQDTASTVSALAPDGQLGAPTLNKTIEEMSETLAMAGRSGTVPSKVRSEALERDTRGILASILQQLGMLDMEGMGSTASLGVSLGGRDDGGEGGIGIDGMPETLDDMSLRGGSSVASSTDLSVKLVTSSEIRLEPADKQVVSLARRYDVIRLGEWWRSVQDDLAADGVRPIEADHFILEYNMRDSFDAALEVQLEQMELRSEAKRDQMRENDTFVGSILDQKHQQIKAEWLKRKAKRNAGLSMPNSGPKVTKL
jgi:hypothetical protein